MREDSPCSELRLIENMNVSAQHEYQILHIAQHDLIIVLRLMVCIYVIHIICRHATSLYISIYIYIHTHIHIAIHSHMHMYIYIYIYILQGQLPLLDQGLGPPAVLRRRGAPLPLVFWVLGGL